MDRARQRISVLYSLQAIDALGAWVGRKPSLVLL
jgi:hypothetical protein